MIPNANSIVQHEVQIKNGIIKNANANVKILVSEKKDYSWNPSKCTCENKKFLKNIADTSVIECDEIMIAMVIVSTKKTNTIATKKTNTIATNVTSAASKFKSKRLLYLYEESYVLLFR